MMRLAISLCFVLAACAGHNTGSTDPAIGAPCASDLDCAHRCFMDGNDHFPGGFCSNSCTSQADCPIDTECVAAAGGVCMFTCPPFDCKFLGPNWRCDSRDLVGGAKADVCIGG